MFRCMSAPHFRSIHLLMDIQVTSASWLVWVMLQSNAAVHMVAQKPEWPCNPASPLHVNSQRFAARVSKRYQHLCVNSYPSRGFHFSVHLYICSFIFLFFLCRIPSDQFLNPSLFTPTEVRHPTTSGRLGARSLPSMEINPISYQVLRFQT